MKTLGIGGFGKAKLTTYNGKKAVVKYINIIGNPSATLATCTINRNYASEEGEVMKKLSQKEHIAEIYEVKGHAIYMKYYEDGSLRDVIDHKLPSLLNKYGIASNIVDGLSEIHNLNFVHSDLKASNILIEHNSIGTYFAVISDFGAARLRGTKAIAYISGFNPPEIHSKPLDFSTDIYSLGKLFIELFTRKKDVGDINYDNYFWKVEKIYFSIDGEVRILNSDDFYYLVRECLNVVPDKRPTLSQIKRFLKNEMEFEFVWFKKLIIIY